MSVPGPDRILITEQALDAAVSSLVDGAPEALDTLSELASALGNDPNFATTISAEIGERAKKTYVDTALSDKSDVGHSHAWSEVTSKPAEFPPESHGHSIADVTGLQAALDDTAADWDDLSGKPATFPPESHTHTMGQVDGLDTALAGKSDTGHTHSPGEVGLDQVDNTADADKPVSTATQQALDSKADQADLDDKIRLVTQFPSNPTPGVLYLKAED